MKKRVFLIVLDSVGIGNAPDAEQFGDKGANTLLGVVRGHGDVRLTNLEELGLGIIDGVDCLKKTKKPAATVARLVECSRGKDTTVGHWELMGIVSSDPLPTYPSGFPKELLEEFSRRTGRGVLCNKPYSGTEVIKDYGDIHVESGDLIVYTSQDSVFQIAAHEDVVPVDELYRICQIAREMLTGKHGVGRVIARPFIGKCGSYTRTDRRRDFSLAPPRPTALDALSSQGLDVIGVGKISDVFAGVGITEHIPSHGNTEGIEITKNLTRRDFHGLCFVNLVDYDMLYGHRQDPKGYGEALMEFDRALPYIIAGLNSEDLLIITADHGCDPTDRSTDHTRECVPLIIYKHDGEGKNLGTCTGFGTVAATVTEYLGVDYTPECGASVLSDMI